MSPFGADLESKGWEEVTLERVDDPPIKCACRQLTRHWAVIFSGEVLSVSLWQRKKSGFIISFSALVSRGLKTDSVAVESLAEAMTFLEDYCAHPLVPPPPVERLVDSILHLQRTLTYTQTFSALVGEALSAWSVHGLNPGSGRIKEKAQA
jgi:hypothetical protein